MKTKTREEWLNEAAAEMKAWVLKTSDGDDYLDPLISVGFPKGSRGRSASHAIGQCWDKTQSGDKERAHIFIIPTMTEPVDIMAVLLHELVHASVGTQCGHRGPFKGCAKAVGLEGKMTATVAGDLLKVKLELLARELGEYPHPGLTVPARGSKGSRLLKVECPICRCIIRMTQKWIDHYYGVAPRCACGVRMEVER